MQLPRFDGWHLLGSFPEDDPDGVGSWLLTHTGDALLLEIPPGLTVAIVREALNRAGAAIRYVTASHSHWDHLDDDVWKSLESAFPGAEFIPPCKVSADRLLHLGGEPLWLIRGPKHSCDDVVTVFRGVAMTGDIELGTLRSVNREVPLKTKRESMRQLRGFTDRTGYRIHSIVSAHLNDVRTSVHWPDLFSV